MKVWVVTHEPYHDNGEVCGVWATERPALEFIASCTPRRHDADYLLWPMELGQPLTWPNGREWTEALLTPLDARIRLAALDQPGVPAPTTHRQ